MLSMVEFYFGLRIVCGAIALVGVAVLFTVDQYGGE